MDQRLHRREIERRSEPTENRPEDDDRRQALRKHHRQRPNRVEHHADHERALASEQIADLAADQNERGGHERLDRHRRLDTAHRRVEVMDNRRDRHVHERRVDNEHEHRRRQKDALTRNAARAFSRIHAHHPPRATALARHSRLDNEDRDPTADPAVLPIGRRSVTASSGDRTLRRFIGVTDGIVGSESSRRSGTPMTRPSTSCCIEGRLGRVPPCPGTRPHREDDREGVEWGCRGNRRVGGRRMGSLMDSRVVTACQTLVSSQALGASAGRGARRR